MKRLRLPGRPRWNESRVRRPRLPTKLSRIGSSEKGEAARHREESPVAIRSAPPFAGPAAAGNAYDEARMKKTSPLGRKTYLSALGLAAALALVFVLFGPGKSKPQPSGAAPPPAVAQAKNAPTEAGTSATTDDLDSALPHDNPSK